MQNVSLNFPHCPKLHHRQIRKFMSQSKVALLEAVWLQVAGDDFSKEKLAESVFKDGGNDMSRLTKEDVVAIIEDRFNDDWHKPAFAFSELLSYYVACGNELTPLQIVGWVLASLAIADAIAHGATEWDRQFNFFFDGFAIIKDKIEVEQSVQILRRVFCAGN